MKISLKEFALTGKFGTIKIGETKSRIIDTLGEPDSEITLQAFLYTIRKRQAW